MMRSELVRLLIGLQAFHVAFLALHDWIPLGRFNDVAAVRRENPGASLLRATVISTAPYALILAASFALADGAFPLWLRWALWIAYGLLFAGEFRAWWLPYLILPEPERAARYRAMFGATHNFLPMRNGIAPNTLHVVLHAATLAVLAVLGVLTWGPRA